MHQPLEQDKPISDEEWPPAPQHNVDMILNTRTTTSRYNLGIYLLGFCVSTLYWFTTWIISRHVVDFVFPSINLLQSVYGSDVLRAVVGIVAALMLMRRKNRFGRPLLTGILITALLFTGIEFITH